MIEDTLTVKMIQNTALSLLPQQSSSIAQQQKQLENNRNRCRENIHSGLQKSKRFPKNQKQHSINRRDHAYSKNLKKNQQASLLKNVSQNNFADDFEESYLAHNFLNFQYAPLRSNDMTTTGYSGGVGHRRKRYGTFNKEAFLQANCHFIVDEKKREDYFVHTIDPDVLVDWQHILFAYLPTHDNPECPICLYPPKVPKMTRCGHVFCWSCILHYLLLDDKNWQKCPICHEAVHENDLKSVVLCERKKFSRLDNVTMKLMRRSKDSLVSVPIDEWQLEKTQLQVWDDHPFNVTSKLMMASSQSIVTHVLEKEKIVLEAQLAEAIADETGEDCFIQLALQRLVEEIKMNSTDEKTCDKPLSQSQIGKEDKKEKKISSAPMSKIIQNEEKKEIVVPIILNHQDELILFEDEEREVKLRRQREISESSGSHEARDKNSYYFYQSDDGQNIFLNSLNARCIIEEYGSLDAGPSVITGQIIDFESYTMTKELRKRYRYLSHLPVACEFIICEVMLRPPILSKQTIKTFMTEFKKRKASRLKKLEEQRKFDQKASAARNRQEGFRVEYYSDDEETVIDLNDQELFPSNFSPQENPLSPQCENKNDSKARETADIKGPSFAQIMKSDIQSERKVITTPTLAWGCPRPIQNPYESPSPYKNQADRNDEDGDGPDVLAPSFKAMFTADLNIPTLVEQRKPGTKHGNIPKGKKQKNKKGTLLFGTGGQRKY